MTRRSDTIFVFLLLVFQPIIAACTVAQAAATHNLESSVSITSYTVVDTGQEKCYDNTGEITCPEDGEAFSGQDAQNDGNNASYLLSENSELVYDEVSGLTWERSPDTTGDGLLTRSDKLSYADALAHCSAHSYANYQGYSDWRLPSIKELYSLIQFNGTDPSGFNGMDTSSLTPFINTDYFEFSYGQTSAGERIIDSQYVASLGGSVKVFGVNFADGRIKGYDLTMPDGSTKTFFVQCVRGNTAYGINDFFDNGDQTITDNATGLMWSKSDSGTPMNWQQALTWVEVKNAEYFLGYNDWRLPNAKELHSILDYSRSPSMSNSAAIDPVFNATSITNGEGETDWGWYWSSTTHAAYNGMGASAVYISFGRGGGWQKAIPNATCYTLYDVHGAGAQRSDPKTTSGKVEMGTACSGGTAYGLGPQGDVQRGENYVRLARDANTLLNSKNYLPMILVNAREAQPAFTLEQTLSDGAQRNTIAFDGLAFITGSLGADSFFPPGKLSDFWGFQYLRDNDPSEMGHNTDFLTRASLNMLLVLTSAQREALIALAESQVDQINQYAYDRFILMKALRRQLEGDLPAGSNGLNQDAVMNYSAQLYRLDGEISYDRAQLMGSLLNELDTDQRAYLDAMVGRGMLEWPVVDEPEELRGLERDVKIAVMTYSGDMFSWYAGSLDADVYFCPERQGTYFGSFYMKDAPAVGNPDYTIPSNLTAEMGEAFLEELTAQQAALITDLVDAQKPALFEIVDRREEVSILLRQFMTGGTPDREAVLSLMERYGELDGEIVFRYVTAFSEVNQMLSAEQRAQLIILRTDQLGDLSFPSGAYLYSQAIPIPIIPDTDFLFLGD